MSDIRQRTGHHRRPPDPGHDPPGQISLAAASRSIASMESIFKTTKLIMEGNCEAVAQTGIAERLRNLQFVIHRGMGSTPLACVPGLNDLLERYSLFISHIQKEMHFGAISAQTLDTYTKYLEEFQDEFEMQFSITTRHCGSEMFSNSSNIIINGGTFVTAGTITYSNTQSTNEKSVTSTHIIVTVIVLFGAAGHM